MGYKSDSWVIRIISFYNSVHYKNFPAFKGFSFFVSQGLFIVYLTSIVQSSCIIITLKIMCFVWLKYTHTAQSVLLGHSLFFYPGTKIILYTTRTKDSLHWHAPDIQAPRVHREREEGGMIFRTALHLEFELLSAKEPRPRDLNTIPLWDGICVG